MFCHPKSTVSIHNEVIMKKIYTARFASLLAVVLVYKATAQEVWSEFGVILMGTAEVLAPVKRIGALLSR